MEKYRLLKPMPTLPVGTIFKWDEQRERYIYQSEEDDYGYTQKEIDANPDWFEEVKDEFKVGQWVIVDNYSERYNNIPLRINHIDEGAYCFFDQSLSSTHNFGIRYIARLATKQEIESHLIAEAKRRGLVEGTRIIIMKGSYRGEKSNRGLSDKYIYFADNDSLEVVGDSIYTIYEKGKWAEIVKEEPFKINGYEMKQNGDLIEFGCAKFSKYQLMALLDSLGKFNASTVNNKLNLNRKIKSITLDSGVSITTEEIQKIVDLCTGAK